MARAVRARVYVTPAGPDATRDEQFRNFRSAYELFEKMCKKEGVIQLYKQKEFYEKPSEKRIRKAKQRMGRTK